MGPKAEAMGEKSPAPRGALRRRELHPREHCALCLSPAPLRESHILPDFFFRSFRVFDEKHRMLAIDVRESIATETVQSAPTEPMLCDRCEGQIARLERYASQVLFHRRGTAWSARGPMFRVHGVDYARWRLFTLSLLWRMHACGLAEFAAVRLGDCHGAALRQMLLAEDPGPPERYPCALACYPDGEEVLERTVRLPQPLRLGGKRAYVLLTGGLLWHWVVDSHVSAAWLGRARFAPDGELPVLILEPGAGTGLVEAMQRRISRGMTGERH